MARRKKLDINGGSIQNFSAELRQTKSALTNVMIDVLDLQISTSDSTYRYDIRQDELWPDLEVAKSHLLETLRQAKNDFLNVTMTEREERSYLYYAVQGSEQKSFTGRRI